MSETEYAFPYKRIEHALGTKVELFRPGMTLRDYFAGQALAGFCATTYGDLTREQAARLCYNAADAMLKAREEA